jgi:imidazole glycerol phosphate synthase glutamine amidotransferase subunit
VVDYGAGNLRSVANVLEVLGLPYRVVTDGEGLGDVDKVILPGVGHFGQLARALDDLALRAPLAAMLGAGVPYLGICLGMQILFATSAEAPGARGLGIFAGDVGVIEGAERLPHMGWNTVTRTKPSTLLGDDNAFYYFANSYACPLGDDTVGECEYGSVFSAVVERGTICGVQFHPEKSGAAGRSVIERFVGA